MPGFFPSLISSDILHLASEIERLQPYIDGFHIDIMDFHFVPNLTWGPDFVNAIRRAAQKQLWIHLMVDTPKSYLDMMQLSKGDIVSIHYETSKLLPLKDLLKQITHNGQEPSVALNPETPISVLAKLFHEEPFPRQILLMSVRPGFSGQAFLPNSLQRLQELVDFRKSMEIPFAIGMDGGITSENIASITKIGVDYIAVGSGIFAQKNQIEAIQKLR